MVKDETLTGIKIHHFYFMEEENTKRCPKCKRKQSYRNKSDFNFAVLHNKLCQSCSKTGKQLSEETKRKIGEKSKLHPPAMLGKRHTQESKDKMSKAKVGENHPMFGKKGKANPSFGKQLSEKTKEKISRALRGILHTPEQNRKIRLSTINLISQNKLNGGQLFPRYDLWACEYFDKLNKEKGWNLQHAQNGGEYYIKELGYWLDAYDKEKNVIVEYDEKWHNRLSRKNKDLIRQKEIINFIHPKEFWRYNEVDKNLIQIL